MLEGLYGQSMLQGTSLIAFQTYHTAEHYRSMNEKLTLYNMRKLPFVYNAHCWIDHKDWIFRQSYGPHMIYSTRGIDIA